MVAARALTAVTAAAAAALALPVGASANAAGPPSVKPSEPAKLGLEVERLKLAKGRSVAALGSRVRVRAHLRPWAPDQKVTIRVYRDGRKVLARTLVPQKVRRQSIGRVLLGLEASRTGRYRVTASHAASLRLTAASAVPRRFSVRFPRLSAGDRGPAVRLLQSLLARRAYPVHRTGVYDGATSRAVLAFRKVNGMARTFEVSRVVFRKLARGGGFRLRYPKAGKHVEVDLSRQVMVLARGGKAYRIYHASTGAGGTPPGRWRFYMRQPGYNGKRMYFSIYYNGGYAIHGFDPVPVYPASHGCTRIPIPNAVFVYNWIRNGDRIDIYR